MIRARTSHHLAVLTSFVIQGLRRHIRFFDHRPSIPSSEASIEKVTYAAREGITKRVGSDKGEQKKTNAW